jgi:hypothetical protein
MSGQVSLQHRARGDPLPTRVRQEQEQRIGTHVGSVSSGGTRGECHDIQSLPRETPCFGEFRIEAVRTHSTKNRTSEKFRFGTDGVVATGLTVMIID